MPRQIRSRGFLPTMPPKPKSKWIDEDGKEYSSRWEAEEAVGFDGHVDANLEAVGMWEARIRQSPLHPMALRMGRRTTAGAREMKAETLQLQQGTPEWLAHRAALQRQRRRGHDAGLSKYKTRAELLRERLPASCRMWTSTPRPALTVATRLRPSPDVRRGIPGHRHRRVTGPWCGAGDADGLRCPRH